MPDIDVVTEVAAAKNEKKHKLVQLMTCVKFCEPFRVLCRYLLGLLKGGNPAAARASACICAARATCAA